MKLCFTVDWEDWYHGLGIPVQDWGRLERRIKTGHYKLLECLNKHKVKATYFLLGMMMEEFPELVEEIKNEGHELACHTYSHPFLSNISPQQFYDEIKKCKDLIAPFQKQYEGFRAPFFSIKKNNLWILDILKNEGFIYDSSIFPGNTFRAGIHGFEKDITFLPNGLIEFPISKFTIPGFDCGIGGAYFRIIPYSYFKYRLQNLLKIRPVLFYFHPWELDEKQPYLRGLAHRAVHTHYYNLKGTEKKLESLFKDFQFSSLKSVLKQESAKENINTTTII